MVPGPWRHLWAWLSLPTSQDSLTLSTAQDLLSAHPHPQGSVQCPGLGLPCCPPPSCPDPGWCGGTGQAARPCPDWEHQCGMSLGTRLQGDPGPMLQPDSCVFPSPHLPTTQKYACRICYSEKWNTLGALLRSLWFSWLTSCSEGALPKLPD